VLLGVALFAWTVMRYRPCPAPHARHRHSAAFGLLLVYLWQAIVVGFAIPAVLLPTPTAIVAALWRGVPTLAEDFQTTFLTAVLIALRSAT